MSADDFDPIASSLDAPVIVLTTAVDGARSGCLVGFHTQCSIEPERWLVCVSKANHTYPLVRRARTLVVHVLRADQLDLAQLFGGETGDEVDKFARCAWQPGPEGVPVLDGCDWIAGPVIDRVDLGDHEGQVIEIVDARRVRPDAPQLGFQAVRKLEPGHPA